MRTEYRKEFNEKVIEGAMSLPPLYCGEVGLLIEMRDAGWTDCSFFYKEHTKEWESALILINRKVKIL